MLIFVVFVSALIESLDATPLVASTLTILAEEGNSIRPESRIHTFSTAVGDKITATLRDADKLHIQVDSLAGEYWSVDLAAPKGEQLAIGKYLNATRYPFADAGPSMIVFGNGRGCNTLTGSFGIKEISMGENGEISCLRAIFEQNCEGVEPALHGDITFVE